MSRTAETSKRWSQRVAKGVCAALATLILASCGGNDSPVLGVATCTPTGTKQWLRDYMYGNPAGGYSPWYFWYALGPNPDPAPYADEFAYLDALRYDGSNAAYPLPNGDEWSTHQSTAAFNQFFVEGQTLGYGLFVAGLEVVGQPAAPLYVRYVEPLSPAGVMGLQRGDRIDSINGRLASDIIAANDYSVLTPASTADSIVVVYTRGAGQFSATLQAANYNLTPVTGAQVVTTPLGRKLGYVNVKDMITQVDSWSAGTPFGNAIRSFKAQGVSDLVLDLRYNGGGFVSVGRDIASYVAASVNYGATYSALRYNNFQARNNVTFIFKPAADTMSLNRAYVLVGRRTCSASEQVINGLRGIGVEVVVVGEATCGKPVGFLPADNGCGTTYSVVNFESVNALNEGRYFGGFAANCPVAEDFTQPLGGVNEPLLNTARSLADGGACPVVRATESPQGWRSSPRSQAPASDGGERPAMIPR